MSVVAGVSKAAGTEVLTGTRPATRRALPRTNRVLVVMAVALLAIVAFAILIPASQAPSSEQSSAESKDYQSGAATPVSEPAAPQMSEEEALDAYGKLPLSFVPNQGQTDRAVR